MEVRVNKVVPVYYENSILLDIYYKYKDILQETLEVSVLEEYLLPYLKEVWDNFYRDIPAFGGMTVSEVYVYKLDGSLSTYTKSDFSTFFEEILYDLFSFVPQLLSRGAVTVKGYFVYISFSDYLRAFRTYLREKNVRSCESVVQENFAKEIQNYCEASLSAPVIIKIVDRTGTYGQFSDYILRNLGKECRREIR